ncbi:PIG-L family deacetylase [uncultured Veillonella sp.]|uniref:PIG-L family deacetylase n=1 Tax=uncultured Veillonella sp. TaxID=159268 RepID=UPI0028DB20D6|nr:PIG-L family deacetylase [uncultured Veillonella sp.]
MNISSFSYEQFFHGNSVMFIVPHEDDEINMAGATIYGAIQEGLEVYVVFLTNGDYEYTFDVRCNETYQMAKEIGLPKENIIFLGFGDFIGHEVIQNKLAIITSHANHDKTYGFDFASLVMNEVQPYSWSGIIQSLIDVILHFKPDTIIATDYDTHVDHRLCTFTVASAIEWIIKHTQFRPQLLKGFAYATGYETIDDYYSNHLLSTVINKKAVPSNDFSTGNPTLSWIHRLRIPVSYDCRAGALVTNPIFKAMAAHMSQEGYKRGSRLINGDQVFWRRRTDNLSLNAVITVSSGEATHLNDFMRFNTENVKSNTYNTKDYMWIPTIDDIERKAHIAFKKNTVIQVIQLFGNVQNTNSYCSIRIEMSNGKQIILDEIAHMGKGISYVFDEPLLLEWIDIYIDKQCLGLSEIELYSTVNDVYDYCHILSDNHFMYDWIVYPGEKIPMITPYIESLRKDMTTYGKTIREDSYRWLINGKYVDVLALQSTIERELSTSPLQIRLESSDRLVFCEATIRKGSIKDWCSLKWNQLQDKLAYIRVKSKYKQGYKAAQVYKQGGI